MNIVLLDPDVAKVFKTPTSVNQALRSLAEIIKAQKLKAKIKLALKTSVCNYYGFFILLITTW